jgi:aryl-alcohol dehydrogenase-like predicted oxidoreductase
MRIGLGTAQFGSDYGVSNHSGRTPAPEVVRILEFARGVGIEVLDTAPAYGDSERALGRALADSRRFQVVTKTDRDADLAGPTRLRSVFHASLRALGLTRVYGLLVHDPKDLLSRSGRRLFEEMARLKQNGAVTKIGVSIYTREQIDWIIDSYAIDLIQLPVNLFDQRLVESGHLRALKKRGIEIHARSVFLQGLLLMDPEELPPNLRSAREPLAKFRETISNLGLSPLGAALGFIADIPEIDVALCGINCLAQLVEIQREIDSPRPSVPWSELAVRDESILNPCLWTN